MICSKCHGSGSVPDPYCRDCLRPCDEDGYCNPCAEAAVEKYREQHGGKSPAETFHLRKTEKAEAHAALYAALKRFVDTHDHPMGPARHCSLCTQARAALRLARGATSTGQGEG